MKKYYINFCCESVNVERCFGEILKVAKRKGAIKGKIVHAELRNYDKDGEKQFAPSFHMIVEYEE